MYGTCVPLHCDNKNWKSSGHILPALKANLNNHIIQQVKMDDSSMYIFVLLVLKKKKKKKNENSQSS